MVNIKSGSLCTSSQVSRVYCRRVWCTLYLILKFAAESVCLDCCTCNCCQNIFIEQQESALLMCSLIIDVTSQWLQAEFVLDGLCTPSPHHWNRYLSRTWFQLCWADTHQRKSLFIYMCFAVCCLVLIFLICCLLDLQLAEQEKSRHSITSEASCISSPSLNQLQRLKHKLRSANSWSGE